MAAAASAAKLSMRTRVAPGPDGIPPALPCGRVGRYNPFASHFNCEPSAATHCPTCGRQPRRSPGLWVASPGEERAVTWGFIWLMFILKIPIVALLTIVWWAVKQETEP